MLLNYNFKNYKGVNEDPACLYVGSHRRYNQPNLKNRRWEVQRLLQRWHNVIYWIISENSAVTPIFFMNTNKPCYWDLLLPHGHKLQKSSCIVGGAGVVKHPLLRDTVYHPPPPLPPLTRQELCGVTFGNISLKSGIVFNICTRNSKNRHIFLLFLKLLLQKTVTRFLYVITWNKKKKTLPKQTLQMKRLVPDQ